MLCSESHYLRQQNVDLVKRGKTQTSHDTQYQVGKRESCLFKLLFKRPLVVLGLAERRRVWPPGWRQARRHGAHDEHRRTPRSHSVLLKQEFPPWLEPVAVVLIPGSTRIYGPALDTFHNPLIPSAARSGRLPVLVGLPDPLLRERHSGERVDHPGVERAVHHRVVVAESRGLPLDLRAHEAAEVLRFGLTKLFLEGQSRCLLPLEVFHHRLQPHAAGLVAVWPDERALGLGCGSLKQHAAAGGQQRAVLRGQERSTLERLSAGFTFVTFKTLNKFTLISHPFFY